MKLLLHPVLLVGSYQADEHQENLVLDKAKKLDADGLVNFITMNEIRYLTEYNQVVGGGQWGPVTGIESGEDGE